MKLSLSRSLGAVVLAALFTTVVIGAPRTALADEPHVQDDPSSPQKLTWAERHRGHEARTTPSPAAKPATTTYASEMLIADSAAWLGGIVLVAAVPPEKMHSDDKTTRPLAMAFAGPGMPLFGSSTLVALGTYLFIPPLIHVLHGDRKIALASFFLRASIPALWGITAALAEGDDDNKGLAVLSGALAVAGYPTIVILDAVLFSKELKVVDSGEEGAARERAIAASNTTRPSRERRGATTILPSLDISPSRASIGIAGTF